LPALPLLLLAFVLVPLVELYLLIEVGQVIGALPTVGLCVLTAVAGGILLRFQGLSTLQRAQAAMVRGEAPALEMLEGVALAIGGGMLLTPGFATDAIGFLCLLPWTRRALIRLIVARARVAPASGGPRARPGADPRTLEGEFRRRDPRRDEPPDR